MDFDTFSSTNCSAKATSASLSMAAGASSICVQSKATDRRVASAFSSRAIPSVTERDEFVYHEMLAHVPLFTHPDPRKVLIIGGGDGGTVREVLKHDGIEEVVLVEIDRMVVEASLEYLPEVSSGLTDPRVEIRYEDGVKFVDLAGEGSFDVILVDSTDPVGPAEALFSRNFFQVCHRALRENGVFASQSESPFFHLPFYGINGKIRNY